MATPEDTGRTIFVTGLRNAHALENQALSIMKRQVERIENYPQLSDRLHLHIRETEDQLKRLDGILESLRESSSTLKDAGMSILGSMASLSHAMAENEILKNNLANFAFENYEIAAYKSLREMAELTGHNAAIAPIEQTLREEIEMARWLDENLASLTSTYLRREVLGQKADV